MAELFEALSVINSPAIQQELLVFRIILGGLGIAMAVFTVYLFLRSDWFAWRFGEDAKEFLTFRPFGVRSRVKRWRKIMSRLESGEESEYKLAVLEADQVAEDIFKRMQFGDRIDEQLERIPANIVSNIEELRQAHQLRDNLAHDPDYRLTREEAERALQVYQASLTALDIL